MERKIQDLLPWIRFVLSPTRFIIDRDSVKRKVGLITWAQMFIVINLALLFSLPLLRASLQCSYWIFWIVIWFCPFSRIVEIAYAFYKDTFERLESSKTKSALDRGQRMKMLGGSYFETAVCYASLYLCLPSYSFSKAPASSFDSLYFSWITITTTGFGDITPFTKVAKFLCMSEVGIGLMLLVLAVGTYFSYADECRDQEHH